MVLDIIVIILLLFAILRGYKKGFSDIVLGIIGFILAVILAFCFKGMIANIVVETTEIDEGINSFILENINLEVSENNEYSFIFSNLNMQDTITEKANDITIFILESACFIGIFIVTLIAVFIIKSVLNLVFELPIIGGINKTLGVIASILIMIVNIWIILLIIQIISPFAPNIIGIIENTELVSILYKNNYLSSIIY